MTNENVNTIVITNRKSQLLLTTTTREKDRISDHRTTTTLISNTTPIFSKDMVATPTSRIIEIKISITRIILTTNRISALGKTTTTFLQDRITAQITSTTETSQRTILVLSLTTFSSSMKILTKL